MNKAYKLLDNKFITEFFIEKVLPLYPDFVSIKKIKINPRKKHIWHKTYHVVIEYKTYFITKDKKIKHLNIFCAAHSNEPREKVYDVLKFLWNRDFAKGYLTIPHPLFYSSEFRGTFYRGVDGHHLYYYIRKNDRENIEKIVKKAALWFAKLHKLKTDKAPDFDTENSRIRTALPGVKEILERVKQEHNKYYNICDKAYTYLIKEEENFLSNAKKLWFVHGDAHPENIVKMSEKKLAGIDFSDFCLSDFARDVGSFMQQLEYMCNRKINDIDFSKKMKNLFLENYLINAKIKLDDSLEKRINIYYNWTALRTAVYFLIKEDPKPERAEDLLKQINQNLNLNAL